MVDVPRIYKGSYISIFRSLPAWEVLHLICVSRVSLWSLGGLWRLLREVFGGFWHGGCVKDTLRKLHISFQISTCLGSAPSPMCLQSVIMKSKRTLEVPERSLGGFWDGGCLKDTSRKIHINFQVSIIPESGPPPGFSRASSKCHPRSLRGCWGFLRGVLVVFDKTDVLKVH